MTQYFRKVLCSERLPKFNIPIVSIFEDGEVLMTTLIENEGWHLFDKEWYYCDQPTAWLEPLEIPDKGTDLINFLLTNALIHLDDEEKMTLYQSIGDRLGQKVYTRPDMLSCWDAALSHALKLKGYYKTFAGFIKSLKK